MYACLCPDGTSAINHAIHKLSLSAYLFHTTTGLMSSDKINPFLKQDCCYPLYQAVMCKGTFCSSHRQHTNTCLCAKPNNIKTACFISLINNQISTLMIKPLLKNDLNQITGLIVSWLHTWSQKEVTDKQSKNKKAQGDTGGWVMFSLWMWYVLGEGIGFSRVCVLVEWWCVCRILWPPWPRGWGKQLYNGGHYITVCMCIREWWFSGCW